MDSLLDQRDYRQPEEPIFGVPLEGFSFWHAGEQLKRLTLVGLHGYRVPLSLSGRYVIRVHNLTYNNLPMRLYSTQEVSAILANLRHLPIAPALRPNDNPARVAARKGQVLL